MAPGPEDLDMKQHRWLTYTLIALLLVGSLGIALARQAEAGPEIVGNPDGAETRALITDGESVRRIVYFAGGSKTMVGANTPVASDPECGLYGNLHKAEVQLTGGMGGTNPTLAIKWQNSIDGGTTWTDVGTWTAINATVTPQTQTQTVADLAASTAVAFGDCWRATYVFGGTGTVTANFSVTGLEK